MVSHPEAWEALDEAGRDKVLAVQPEDEDAPGVCILCEQPTKLQPLDWEDWDRWKSGREPLTIVLWN